MGEGYPDRFYGETPETMAAVFPLLLEKLGQPAGSSRPSAGSILAGSVIGAAIRGHGAAKCAIDIALHDLVGKILGLPVHVIRGLPAVAPPTDFTIGIDEPAVVAERARRAADFPALKIKCGGPSDLATLRAVREVFDGPIRVDANTGWTARDADALLPELVDLGVELIEQPFPARAYRDLGWLQERSAMPIVADESCVFPEDLEPLVGVVAGVNVKLAKCGGIGAAKRHARARPRARVPDVPRLHGGDVGRDRRLGRRRVTGRVGRSRRQPAARRRPVRGARARAGQALAPGRPARTRPHAPSGGTCVKVVTILGTRPEIIRLSRVIPLLDRLCDHVLVHTGQNYEPTLSDVFFDELGVRAPDHRAGHPRRRPSESRSAAILVATERACSNDRPDRVLILGDTEQRAVRDRRQAAGHPRLPHGGRQPLLR